MIKITSGSSLYRNKEDPLIVWEGLYCPLIQAANIKELILLESHYTDTVFCNLKHVLNVLDSENPINSIRNEGLMKLQQKFDIPYINNLWYQKSSIINVISMKYTTWKVRVTMDSEEELALLAHMPNKIVNFRQISNGLYAMDLND